MIENVSPHACREGRMRTAEGRQARAAEASSPTLHRALLNPALTAEALDFAAECIAGRAVAWFNHEIMRTGKARFF